MISPNQLTPNLPLTSFPPAYPYLQFNDDPYVGAFFTALNLYQQAYLDAFNNLQLPIYTLLTSLTVTINLQSLGEFDSATFDSYAFDEGGTETVTITESNNYLDWILNGIYGVSRPIFGQITGTTQKGGPYDTWAYDTQQYDANGFTYTYSYTVATEDQYARVATWNLYWGDGRQFNARWLKRRVLRFLTGANGTDPGIDQTYLVSVTFTPTVITIGCDSSLGSGNITALTEAMAGGFLGVPFIYAFQVVTT